MTTESIAVTSLNLVRRSMLCGPISSPTYLEMAWKSGADAIMLDLEDTVPLAVKDQARVGARDAVELAARGGSDVLIRFNSPWEMAEADLDASIWPGVTGVVAPEVETAESIRRLADKLAELEAARGITAGTLQIAVTIESVAGLAAVNDVLAASKRSVSVTLGAEDFCRDIDVESTPKGDEILLAQLQIVLAARLAEVSALAGVMGGMFATRDPEAARVAAGWLKSVGYRGAACVSVEQVRIANEAFSPSPEAVTRAEKLLVTYEEASAAGEGLVPFEGGLIDVPMVSRAHRLLARAERVRQIDKRKSAALAKI